MHSGWTLVYVFAFGVLAASFLVPYVLVRDRSSLPFVYGLVGIAIYIGSGWTTRTLLVAGAPSVTALGATYQRGDISFDEYNATLAEAMEQESAAIRGGFGVGLAFAVAFGWGARRWLGKKEAETLDDGPAQLAGSRCDVCERTIAVETDAKRCKGCGAIIHKRCATAHRRATHREEARPVTSSLISPATGAEDESEDAAN